MVRRFILALTFLVTLNWIMACTTMPKFSFPQGTRLGIINLLEPYATHQNFTSFATKNFSKTYTVDWDIPAYAQDRLRTLLEEDGHFSVVEIKVSEPMKREKLRLSLIEELILSETATPKVPTQATRLLDTITDPYDVDVVVLIGSYSGPSPFKSGEKRLNVQGYGLFTRKLFKGIFGGKLSFRKAYAYAQIGVVVLKVQPVHYVAAAGTTMGRRLPIRDFNWEIDLKNLPESELDKAKPHIQDYINDVINTALQNAHLAP